MIFDQQNLFYDAKALTGTAVSSNVVANGAGGDAVNPLWVAIKMKTAVSSAATAALKTSDSEDMSGAVTLTTVNIATTTKSLNFKLPQGCKKFLTLDIAAGTALTTGNITAGLVSDV